MGDSKTQLVNSTFFSVKIIHISEKDTISLAMYTYRIKCLFDTIWKKCLVTRDILDVYNKCASRIIFSFI